MVTATWPRVGRRRSAAAVGPWSGKGRPSRLADKNHCNALLPWSDKNHSLVLHSRTILFSWSDERVLHAHGPQYSPKDERCDSGWA